jgi:hypothetical protein
MTNEKRHKPLGLLAAGILFVLPILWLSASVAFDATPRQKKHKNLKQMAQPKGSPDNAGGLILPAKFGSAASIPKPPYPPYEPVPMTASVGTTGLVVYGNTNGVALVNPRNHTISPVMLNEFDYTIDPETNQPIGGQLGTESGGRWDIAMTSDGRQALLRRPELGHACGHGHGQD